MYTTSKERIAAQIIFHRIVFSFVGSLMQSLKQRAARKKASLQSLRNF